MRKSRVQFSMASLLLAVTVMALFSLWFAKLSNTAHEQQAAVEEVEESEGIIVDYRTKIPAPAWLRKALGDAYFRSAKTIDFATQRGRKRGSDEPKATDENLKYLEVLTDVKSLELGNSEEVTDNGLVHLKPLKDLTTLYLYQTGVRGPGLRHIAELPRLTAISLSRTKLEDSGLKHLGRMSTLTWLRLDHTSVTDSGLADLVSARALKTLGLRNTSITDVGLRYLEALKQMESLNIVGTKVTPEGVERFKMALPDCHVFATFGLGEAPSDELLFAEGYQPTASEINAKLRELNIDGEVEADDSLPGSPIVSIRLFSTKLSDRVVLSLIKHTPELQMLNLRRGLVGDELLEGIGSLPIRYLSLEETRITDDGLRHLSKFAELKTLILNGTDITDEGLVHLHGLSSLDSVTLDDCRTTRNGVERLREALPNW